jgi:putative transcriptional regulator
MPIYWKLKAMLDAMDAKPGAVAASVELHRQSLYAILKEPRAGRIEGDTLERLCAALGCQPGDLLEYRDD